MRVLLKPLSPSTAARLAAILALSASASACVSTQLTSMKAPEANGVRFSRFLVLASVEDLEMRQFAERQLQDLVEVDRSAGAGRRACDPVCRYPAGVSDSTTFVPDYSLLHPRRSYTQAPLREVLTENEIQAVLVLFPRETGVEESYIPPSFATSCTNWNATTSCSTSAFGGGTVSKPWARFSARLYSAQKGETLWIATANSGGSALSSLRDLIR